MTAAEKNALAVTQYLNFLAEIFKQRLSHYFNEHNTPPALSEVNKIVSIRDDSEISRFITKHDLRPPEIILLLLALAPHVRPGFFDSLIQEHLKQSGEFPQIGGIRGKQSRGFLPTGETLLFLVAGDDLSKRFEYISLFTSEHFFAKSSLLWLDEPEQGEPPLSGKLEIAKDYIELFTLGISSRPRLSMDFPAEYCTTELTSDDLVLPEQTSTQVHELEQWIRHKETLMNKWNMKRWLKPGYRALFHGPPGTGKTLTSLIIGKNTGRDVFRIDLSMIVSKFIGETEKNLSQLFERANNKNWILFFDEADALFGKRTNIRDAHDKYANQEASYLLQRIENHDGLVILATNFKSNIDEAFIRRFQSVVYFPPPSNAERFILWKKYFPSNIQLPTDNDIQTLAKKYEITGAGIANVVQYCCIKALAENSNTIRYDDIRLGIEREYYKEGKVF